MLTQVALDVTSLSRAIELAEACAEAGIHLLEAGTPLIKSCGVRAVKALVERFPERPVVADTKTMDTGALEAELVASRGAGLGCVLGAAPEETIESFVTRAHELGMGALVDTIGAEPGDVLRKLDGLSDGPDYLLIHAAVDESITGEQLLERAGVSECPYRTAVAGGLTPEKVEGLDGVDAVIVGGYITSSEDPGRAAEEVLEAAGAEPYGFRPNERQREALLGLRRRARVGIVVRDPDRVAEVLRAAVRSLRWVRREADVGAIGDDDLGLLPEGVNGEGRDLLIVVGAEEFEGEELERLARDGRRVVLVSEEHVLKVYGVAEAVYEV
ncbi:MAG: orotidine 5'-phosphate decarboxylase / HUMPS family protein [Euryarchaeota archaeon]